MLGKQKYEYTQPEPSAFEFELVIEKLKSQKSPGIDQIPEELIKTGSRTIRYEIQNLLFIFGVRKTCLRSGRSGRSRSEYLSIRRAIKQIVVIIGAYHSW